MHETPEQQDSQLPWNPIRYWTKTNHWHLCLRAFNSKDIEGFVIQFLCLMNNVKNEPRLESSLRDEVAKITGWIPRSIKDAITKLIKQGEFERVKGKLDRIRLNPYLYNRLHAFSPAITYTGNQPQYTKEQKLLGVKLSALESKSHYYAYSRAEGENEMKIMALQEKIGDLSDKISEFAHKTEYMKQQSDELKQQNDKMFEMIEALLKKVSPSEETKEIERHLKLIKGGLEE